MEAVTASNSHTELALLTDQHLAKDVEKPA